MAVLMKKPVIQVVSNANPQTLASDVATALATIKTAALAQSPESTQVSGLIDRNSLEVSDVTLIYNSTDVALYYCTIRYSVLF